MSYLKLQWWNDHDLGNILYQDGFKNTMYLDIEVEKPEYNTTIESDLNGDNVEITKFRKWEKVYKFEFWGQEDLVDAFSIMQIHDNIEVTLQTGEVIEVAKHGLRVEPSWEEIGCLAKCVVSFAENYTIAGNCDENLDAGCLCATSGGDFAEIIAYSLIGTVTPVNDKVVLAWTVEDIAGKKYTAKLYKFSYSLNTWVEQFPDQNVCWDNLDDSTTWIFDGQFWHLSPGYVSNIASSGADITVTGWVVPGAFVTIYATTAAVPGPEPWVDMGDYTADELAAGVLISPLPFTSFASVYLHVWNHSCDYLNTEHEAFIF